MKQLYALLIGIILMISYSHAQPILDAANFNPVLGQDVTLHSFVPASLMPGGAGANQTWNFASTPNQGTLSFTFVTPASTPYGASFPTANLANNQNGAYEYLITNSNYFARAGAWASGIAIPYTNEEKFVTFPFTFNSTYTDNFAATFTTGGFTFNRTGSVTGTADGYGTLILPWGTLTNVLRIHYTETFQDVYSLGTIYYSTDSYAWFKPGTHYLLYNISSATANGSVTYNGFYIDPVSVGLNVVDAVEIRLNLFPNPCVDNMDVNFEIPEASPVQLTISNTLGQDVYSSEPENFPRGAIHQRLEVSDFPDGLYFLTIHVGYDAYVSKFIVKK